MKIPKNTVSPSQLRTYGSADIRTDDQEADRGCPRRWKARYVDGIKDTETSYALTYGSIFHRVMENVVAAGSDPHTAVLDAIGSEASVEMVDELMADLETYLARPSSDMDDMAVLGTELDLKVPLYDDPEYGTIYFRSIIDLVAIDPNDPGTIHVKDYKSNRSPIAASDLAGDAQMRAYAWIVKQLSERWTDSPDPRVIVHLDLIKFRDYVYEYSDDELDAWHTWAVAIVRTILRDEKAEPVINSQCSSCIVRHDCPALLELPKTAKTLADRIRTPEGIDVEVLAEARRWRDEANAARLALEKAVKAWDMDFTKIVKDAGPTVLDGKVYAVEPNEKTVVDVFAVAEVLGEDFPRVATVSKAAIERSSLDESLKSQALAQWRSEIDGTKLTARKAQ